MENLQNGPISCLRDQNMRSSLGGEVLLVQKRLGPAPLGTQLRPEAASTLVGSCLEFLTICSRDRDSTLGNCRRRCMGETRIIAGSGGEPDNGLIGRKKQP